MCVAVTPHNCVSEYARSQQADVLWRPFKSKDSLFKTIRLYHLFLSACKKASKQILKRSCFWNVFHPFTSYQKFSHPTVLWEARRFRNEWIFGKFSNGLWPPPPPPRPFFGKNVAIFPQYLNLVPWNLLDRKFFKKSSIFETTGFPYGWSKSTESEIFSSSSKIVGVKTKRQNRDSMLN